MSVLFAKNAGAFPRSEPMVFYAAKQTIDPVGWHSRAHSHAHHELLVLLRGQQRALIDGEWVRAGSGDALLFPTGCSHEQWCESEEPMVELVIGFSSQVDLSELPYRLADGQGRLAELAEWISYEIPLGHPSEVGLPEPLVYALVGELRRAAARGGSALKKRAHDVMERDMNQIRSVEALARALGFSRSHLSRRFANEFGESPSDFMRRVRFKRARHLLVSTSMGVKEVAAAVGVANPQQLCRMVRQVTGLTTRELRKNAR